MAKRPTLGKRKRGTPPKGQRSRPAARKVHKSRKAKLLRGRLLRYGAVAFLVMMVVGSGGGYLYYRSLFRDMPPLPPVAEMWSSGRQASIEFVTAEGETIATRGPRYGRRFAVADLPAYVPQAFIAAEDKRFYEHDGADTTAIARAAWSNFTSGRTVSGASTITQQLVKNLVLDSRQTIKRKAQEVRLARQLETILSKEEILELYLNRIYFGSSAYGLDAAAREYFGKSPSELTLAEAALLATLPKAPSRLALDQNLEGAKERQSYVLREMVEAGYITPGQRAAAEAEEIALTEYDSEPPELGYVFDMVGERLAGLVPDAPGDLVVTLSIDPALQSDVQALINERLEVDGEALNASEAAALVMDHQGAILAMIGGRDYVTSQFNRATQAKRQPGSAFKALVYAAALQAGLGPYDVRSDQPVTFDDWTPSNYTEAYYGPVTLSEAFAKSLNTVSAQIGQEVGEEAIIDLARRFGITSELRPLPSIALGSQEVSLYELTRAFGVFARIGKRVDPYLILKVEDSRGNVLYRRPEYDAARVYPEPLARQMNGMLARVVEAGTGRRSQVAGWSVAGKTGTSQDWRDAWFVGFSARRIAGVWVGNDDDSPMAEVAGGGLPAELWSAVMTRSHAGLSSRRLAGTGLNFQVSETARERISFYRGLASAFRGAQDDETPIR